MHTLNDNLREQKNSFVRMADILHRGGVRTAQILHTRISSTHVIAKRHKKPLTSLLITREEDP